MDLLPLLRWIGETPVAQAIDDSAWAFPVIESIHILGMALLAGTIVVLNLRVLGMGLRSRTAPELAREIQPWTLLGIGIMLITGPLLFSTDPVRYAANPAFAFKMQALLAAVFLHFALHSGATASRKLLATRGAKAVACLSLALWMAVLVGARWIATY